MLFSYIVTCNITTYNLYLGVIKKHGGGGGGRNRIDPKLFLDSNDLIGSIRKNKYQIANIDSLSRTNLQNLSLHNDSNFSSIVFTICI